MTRFSPTERNKGRFGIKCAMRGAKRGPTLSNKLGLTMSEEQAQAEVEENYIVNIKDLLSGGNEK